MALKRRFINEVYGGVYKNYLRDRRNDYCRVQFIWSCWIDSLCRDGEISQKQYENEIF